MKKPADPIQVPRLGAAAGDAVFQLTQPWRATPEPGFRPGRVHLAWTPQALQVRAELEDIDVGTSATADNQRFWELGDVMEIFIQVSGREDYVELHVTPSGLRLHFRFPGAVPSDPAAFGASARIVPHGWAVEARIPPGVLSLAGFAAGQELRVSFCRYDASRTAPPVLSTCARHPVISFHQPTEWPLVVLVDGDTAMDAF